MTDLYTQCMSDLNEAVSADNTIKRKPMTAKMLEVLGWIEEWWLRREEFPPVDALSKFWPDFDLGAALKHETFLYALDQRGIRLPSPDDKLTPAQIAAIATLSNFTDARSRSAKLRDLGISTAQWQGWLKNKHFKQFLHELASNNFVDNVDAVQEGLLNAARRGSTDAVKLYMEMTGRYTGQSQEVLNLKIILSRLLEAIQMHVKDPNVIREIGIDFELIMAGGKARELKVLDV